MLKEREEDNPYLINIDFVDSNNVKWKLTKRSKWGAVWVMWEDGLPINCVHCGYPINNEVHLQPYNIRGEDGTYPSWTTGWMWCVGKSQLTEL